MFSSSFSFGGSPMPSPSSNPNTTTATTSSNDKKRRSWKAPSSSNGDDEFKIKLVGSDNQIIVHNSSGGAAANTSTSLQNSNEGDVPSSSSALLMRMGRNSSGGDLNNECLEQQQQHESVAQPNEVLITVSSPSPKSPLTATSPFPNKLLSTSPKLSTSSGIESRITMPIEQIKTKVSLSKKYETVEKAVEGGESIIKVMLMNGEKVASGLCKKFVFVEVASGLDSNRKVYSSLSETSVEYDNIIWNEELFISVTAQESITVNLRTSDDSIEHSGRYLCEI